jgi:hypothetical protein
VNARDLLNVNSHEGQNYRGELTGSLIARPRRHESRSALGYSRCDQRSWPWLSTLPRLTERPCLVREAILERDNNVAGTPAVENTFLCDCDLRCSTVHLPASAVPVVGDFEASLAFRSLFPSSLGPQLPYEPLERTPRSPAEAGSTLAALRSFSAIAR